MTDSSSTDQTYTPYSLSTKIEVRDSDRWEIYHRLRELGIDCQCKMHQPLKVQVSSPGDAIQLWSVIQQITAPRCHLLRWIDKCWYKNYSQ